MPKISIVIPNSNGGPSVLDAIDSVLAQTCTDWELIVADDRSIDGSREMVLGRIESKADLRISLITAPDRPVGIPALMNMAGERACGEYVAWLRPAATWTPDRLAEAVRVLEADSVAGMVHSAFTRVDAEGDANVQDCGESADPFTALIAGNIIDVNTVLVRRRVLAELGPFTETAPGAPDRASASEYYHWLRLAVHHPVRYIHRPLVRVRGSVEAPGSEALRLSLERFFIRGCFERENPRVTPAIVCALGLRGAIGTFLEAFGRLAGQDRIEALSLLRQSGIDEAWMSRHGVDGASASGGRATEIMLRHRVLAQTAGLKEALISDGLDAAHLLLGWSANAANFAIGSALSEATMATFKTSSAAESYFEQFLPNVGAVYCDGMSVFYDRVLKAFGRDSFIVNFGDARDDLNHVCVNLPEWNGSEWRHYLFDPTFNTTFYRRSTGQQVDFFEMVDTIHCEECENFDVIAVSKSVDRRDWISSEPLAHSTFALRDVVRGRFVYGRQDGTLDDYLERIDRDLHANGYATGLRGLVELMRARVFRIGPCRQKAAAADFIAKLGARGIPFGKVAPARAATDRPYSDFQSPIDVSGAPVALGEIVTINSSPFGNTM